MDRVGLCCLEISICERNSKVSLKKIPKFQKNSCKSKVSGQSISSCVQCTSILTEKTYWAPNSNYFDSEITIEYR